MHRPLYQLTAKRNDWFHIEYGESLKTSSGVKSIGGIRGHRLQFMIIGFDIELNGPAAHITVFNIILVAG